MSCGACSHGVRCSTCAVKYARDAMDAKGWRAITDIQRPGGQPLRIGQDDRDFLELLKRTNVDAQYWVVGFQNDKHGDRTLAHDYGWYVPKALAVVIGLYWRRLPMPSMWSAIKATQLRPELADAMEAAWHVGGPDAVDGIVRDAMPGLLV